MKPASLPSTFLFALVLTALLAPSPRADEISVPGDFATIQQAIDAASFFDVIVVTGGVHAPIVIDKPLFIVGAAADRPRIRPADPGEETLPFTQDPAVTLAGVGVGTATLTGLDLGGGADGSYFGTPGAGLAGGGFEEVRLIDCNVSAAEWFFPTGLGEAADAVVLSGVPALLISHSTIQGGTGTYDLPFPFPFPLPDGGRGLLASATTVTVLDSVVRGGSGLDMDFDFAEFCPTCGQIGGGTGGIAIVADEVFHAGSVLQGGPGATLRCFTAPSTITLICTKTAGAAIVEASQVVDLPGLLLGSGPFVENSTVVLTWSSQSPSVLLAYSTFPIPPLSVGAKGWLFLHPGNLFLLPVPGGPLVSVSFPIPASTGAVGIPLGMQIFDPAVGLSRPLVTAFVPQ